MPVHLDTVGPTTGTSGSPPAIATIDFQVIAGGETPLPGKCPPPALWYGPIEPINAPGFGLFDLVPPSVDTSGWTGITIQWSVDVATWPTNVVNCELDVQTEYDWDITMAADYRGEHQEARNAYSAGSEIRVVTFGQFVFEGPVTMPLPTIHVTPTWNLYMMNAIFHVAYIAHSVATGFVPAPTLPPDPPEPVAEPYSIGPCV